MASRRVRLIVLPAILFLLVSGTVFTVAMLHPAKAEKAASTGPVAVGDAEHGAKLFAESCASCHGEHGRNGSVGPELAGNPISLADARAQIESGGGAMPPNLVAGQDLKDVLAYLKTILAGQPFRDSD